MSAAERPQGGPTQGAAGSSTARHSGTDHATADRSAATDTAIPEIEPLYQPKVDRVVLARLLNYARPYRRRIALAVVLLLLLSAAELVFPLLTRRGIDRYIGDHDLRGLGRLSLVYFAILVGVFLTRYWQLVLTQATGQRITTDLRDALFGHLQSLNVSYFERNPVGRIMTRLTGDVEALNDLFTSGLVSIFGDLITLLGIAGILFWLNFRLALVTLIVVPPLLIVTMIFRAKVRTAYGLIRARIAAINAFLQESIAGVSLVQLFHRESIHEEKFAHLNARHRDAFLQSVLYYSIYFPVVELLEALALALILWYGGGCALRHVLTFGSLVAFIQYSERFFRPIRDLSERYNILQGAMAASERIFELLDTEPKIQSPPAALLEPLSASERAGAIVPALEFRQVRFAYLPGEEVLKGISFSIPPGESVALVGPTGAGKSTIAALVCRFYDVNEGSIRVLDRDVRAWDLRQLRRQVATVPQEVFLWSGDIHLNVALRDGRPAENVEAAIRITGLEDLVHRFAGEQLRTGPAAGVGERGAQLSSGERQLVSFARALAADPPILILDEATSHVDTETEQKIRGALRRLLLGRTSLVIAHRLSTIRHVNRILVLHHGELVEEGTHEELIRRGGIYRKYYELEYRGQEVSI